MAVLGWALPYILMEPVLPLAPHTVNLLLQMANFENPLIRIRSSTSIFIYFLLSQSSYSSCGWGCSHCLCFQVSPCRMRHGMPHAVLSHAVPCCGTCPSHVTHVPHTLGSAVDTSSASSCSPPVPSCAQHHTQPGPCLAPGAGPHPACGAMYYALFIRQHLPRL